MFPMETAAENINVTYSTHWLILNLPLTSEQYRKHSNFLLLHLSLGDHSRCSQTVGSSSLWSKVSSSTLLDVGRSQCRSCEYPFQSPSQSPSESFTTRQLLEASSNFSCNYCVSFLSLMQPSSPSGPGIWIMSLITSGQTVMPVRILVEESTRTDIVRVNSCELPHAFLLCFLNLLILDYHVNFLMSFLLCLPNTLILD